MPNSLCSSFSRLLIHVIQSSGHQQGSRAPRRLSRHFLPWVTPSLLLDQGEDLGDKDEGTEERRAEDPCDSIEMEHLCGYPSNTDYYVVPQLTLMGCYNDLKWFNGSQVGAPNGPLYTPMRIMNGNDSVVKCSCFFRFLSRPSLQPLLRQCDRCRFVLR